MLAPTMAAPGVPAARATELPKVPVTARVMPPPRTLDMAQVTVVLVVRVMVRVTLVLGEWVTVRDTLDLGVPVMDQVTVGLGDLVMGPVTVDPGALVMVAVMVVLGVLTLVRPARPPRVAVLDQAKFDLGMSDTAPGTLATRLT
jgi:hypothetical protein